MISPERYTPAGRRRLAVRVLGAAAAIAFVVGLIVGSVTPTDIADELWRTAKVRVDRRKIDVENLKRIGRYEVPIDLFQDVRVEVTTLVLPEGGELPSEAELEAMAAAEQEAAAPAEPVHEGPAIEELLVEEPEPAAAAEAEAGGEAEPDWRADAEAALADE